MASGWRACKVMSKAYDQFFIEAGKKHNVDPFLLKAIAHTESRFNPKAINKRTGASGMMQFMPATAKEMGVKDPLDPRQAIFGAAKYVRYMMDRPWIGDNMDLIAAGYNAGPFRRSLKEGKVPNIKETQDYVAKINTHYKTLQSQKKLSVDPQLAPEE